ncbi:hypothetical protein QZH41_007287 [Actinostola sp. cb2023]|nr:hypothetical protein QZH41_007287 [Actinostola sp. cb2023]
MAEITKIEKLNGRNYQSWKYNMKLVLMERGLWGFTQPGGETPPEADATATVKNAFRLRSDKAYSLIALNVEKDLQIHISSVTDPSIAWEKLQKQFEFVSVTQIVRLTRKFYAASMDEGADMMQHLTHMTRLAEQLRELKEDISSKKFATVVLGSLPESYENFLTSLNARNADDLDWENVKGLLIEESMKRADKSEKQESDNALFMKRNRGSNQQQHGAGGRGGYFSGRGRGGYNRGGRLQTQFDDQEKHGNVRCYSCNRLGHIMRNCPFNNQQDSSRNEGSNMAEYAGDEHEGIALISSTTNKSGEWFIDSAATKHMTNDKSSLKNYVEYDQPTKIYLGDDTVIMALGEGKVGLTLCETADIVLDLHKVLYVPKLTKNLLSVPAMALMGAEIRFDRRDCVVVKNDKEYVIGSLMDNKLYTVNTVEYAQAATAPPEPSLAVWHCRLGHLNYDYINQLTKKEMVHGMNYNATTQDEKQCEACILGKMQRKSFPKHNEHRATRHYEIVHSDVCGPMQVESEGGSRYMLTFIDDYSRYTTTYFIKSKSEVLSKFKEYTSYVEKQFGHQIKILRSDNGGEYISNDSLKFCKEKGISREFTNPHCPEQNGVAERLNRTIMESARSMIKQANLPLKFWAEACSTAVYLHNRSPTAALKDETPFERLFGRKPNISHLKVFGCVSYVHVPDSQRKKLDAKARKAIFVGYPPGIKGYKLYDLEKKKFVVSRNVQFLEDKLDHFVKKSESDNTIHTDLNSFSPDMDEEIKDGPEFPIPEAPIEREENVEPVGVPVGEAPVGRTYEDTFIEEVQNLGPRQRRPPRRFRDDSCLLVDSLTSEIDEPNSVDEALKGELSAQWQEAMNSEYSSLLENDTWELVPPPEGANVIGSRWVFKVKRDENGSVDRFKGRLVAQGYSQMKGIDYDEVFSPVARHESLRSLLALANAHDLEMHQMDVTTAFLNGTLDCEIYMSQPEGFVDPKKPDHVCKLKKSIYGLKQSARCWNTTIDEYLKSADYRKSDADGCIYVKSIREADGHISYMIMGVYVDDIVTVSNDCSLLKAEKAGLCQRFKMVDQGEIHYLLGMSIKRDRASRTLTINQPGYLEKVLKRFGMENCKPVSTPLELGKKFQQLSANDDAFDDQIYRQAIGCLTYASTTTRPDIAAAVGVLSQYTSNPSNDHWMGIKRVLRYIKGTMNYGLKFSAQEQNPQLIGYSDADWAGDIDTRKSTSGYVFQFGNGTVSWSSRKQSTVAKSSTEAEYVALSSATQEAIWLRRLMKDLGGRVDTSATTIYEDNQGAIELAKNAKYHNRTKHIDICHHFVRERIVSNEISVSFCPTEDMVADIMTKGLTRVTFEKLRDLLGVDNVV